MRAELIGHFKPCMTEIITYIHIDARMADYIRTHPYERVGTRAVVWRLLAMVQERRT